MSNDLTNYQLLFKCFSFTQNETSWILKVLHPPWWTSLRSGINMDIPSLATARIFGGLALAHPTGWNARLQANTGSACVWPCHVVLFVIGCLKQSFRDGALLCLMYGFFMSFLQTWLKSWKKRSCKASQASIWAFELLPCPKLAWMGTAQLTVAALDASKKMDFTPRGHGNKILIDAAHKCWMPEPSWTINQLFRQLFGGLSEWLHLCGATLLFSAIFSCPEHWLFIR